MYRGENNRTRSPLLGSPSYLSTFKRSYSKKIGKTPSSHIIHSLGGEYCWIVRDSEPIRLLESPRSLSVYILKNNIHDIFGIVVNDVLIIEKYSLKCKCLIWSKPIRFSFECSLSIKVHACNPNMPHLLAVALMNN